VLGSGDCFDISARRPHAAKRKEEED